MQKQIQLALKSQFGASIDMLTNVINKCPENYYIKKKRFFYIAFHTIILLDYYLSFPPKKFEPKLSFTISNKNSVPIEAVDDLNPNRYYSKEEMMIYIEKTKIKLFQIIDSLTDENIDNRFIEGNKKNDLNFSILEILLYNLRHTQHHIAQLHLMLKQDLNLHIEWSFTNGELY
jgi:hypothetical protein